MTDQRITPANGRVAAIRLKGQVTADKFVKGQQFQCVVSAADILDDPDGTRISQIIYGDQFEVFERLNGYAFGQCVRDGYCGYIREDFLGNVYKPTHWVGVPSTHIYPDMDIKLKTEGTLYFGSELCITGANETWSQLTSGQFVPRGHLLPIKGRLDDHAGVADLFLGTPYLWGGVNRYGIDCSGLVQIALRACGISCPRDSDMQENALGRQCNDQDAVQRGDLVFWKGHVGIVADGNRLLHANAHHMAVVYEPLDDAISRIEKSGGGQVTAVRRL